MSVIDVSNLTLPSDWCPDGVNSRVVHRTGIKRSREKKRKKDSDTETTEDEECDAPLSKTSQDTQDQAIKLLTGLLVKVRSGDGEERPKKKLSEMTMAELDHEQKETSIKLARMKCQKLKESIKKYSNLNTGFDIVVDAVESMIEVSKYQLASPQKKINFESV